VAAGSPPITPQRVRPAGVRGTVIDAAERSDGGIKCARHGRGIGGEGPLGTLSEGTPHLGDKGAVREDGSGGRLLVKCGIERK
jgi:hypothetical protein